jgi:ATP-dependent helicase/nuclease subunit A
MEVRTALSFLSVIDNPRQDIPLATVLKSGMYRFDSNDMGMIKGRKKTSSFYDLLKEYLEDGEDEELKRKTQKFLSELDLFREFFFLFFCL